MQLSALRCATCSLPVGRARACIPPHPHASSGLYHPLQATDCCLIGRKYLLAMSGGSCQAPACSLPQGSAGLLAASGMNCPVTSVFSGCHAEGVHVLCCRGTEQDLYNILGALYTAVLFVSPTSGPACLCRSPCSLPGLPAGRTCMGTLGTHRGQGPLLPPPGGKAHCCLILPVGPLMLCIFVGEQACWGIAADLQLQPSTNEMLTLSACSWAS